MSCRFPIGSSKLPRSAYGSATKYGSTLGAEVYSCCASECVASHGQSVDRKNFEPGRAICGRSWHTK